MLTQRAFVLGGALQVVGSLKAIPGVTTPDETIDGFPEFAFTVDTIKDPEVERKLRKLAKRIVASHNGPDRIIGFEVHGHADQTLRVAAGAERDRVELEVSRDRAENAKELLIKMIEEEGGTPIIAGIKANAAAAGFGSKHRVFKPATTEPQMRKNRRVEIFLKTFVPPKPTPPPGPAPKPTPRPKQPWRIQIKNGTVVTVLIPGSEVSSLTITLVVEITDLKRKQKARFRVVATGGGAPSATFPGVPSPVDTQTIMQGKATDFVTTDETSVSAFEGAVEVGMSPGAGVSVLSAGGQFAFSFRDLEKTGRFTVPPMVVAEGGSSPLQLPQASLGGFTTGKLSMQGSPSPAP
jgi:outer membrane protein OmpA-like peptidoglycan-associated protein